MIINNFSTNLHPKKSLSAASYIYILLVNIFIGVLLITNVITAKYIRLGPFTLTAGAVTYPFTFTLLDIIAEVYGKERAKSAVWMGLITSILMSIILKLATLAPIHSQSIVSQQNFQKTFSFAPGILLASMLAYLVSQVIDIYLFGYIARLTKGQYLWLRNIGSTLISQLIDTILFGWIAWIVWPTISYNLSAIRLPWHTWYQLTCNEYLFKAIFTIFNIPLVYLGVHIIKRFTQSPTKLYS